jgi:3-phosphoshikimate 1-carboxyvinyltransferase
LRERRLPGPLTEITGRVSVPTSKSLTNRALIVAAAAGGGRLLDPLDCEDTRLLAGALKAGGWRVDWSDSIHIGERRRVDRAELNLGNSGTGSRLLMGLLACVPGRFRIDGTARLRERPMQPLVETLRNLGSKITSHDGFLPVDIVGGRLAGGFASIRPEVSSQFVSSLLLAAPLMEQGLEVEVLGPIPSRPYLDLTRQVLAHFGATVDAPSNALWRVGGGGLRPMDFQVEGDWSAVAFVAAAVAVAGGKVSVGPLGTSSHQGDRAVAEILRQAGLELEFDSGQLTLHGKMTRPLDGDLTDTPDLFPALAVVAATGPEGSVLRGLDHLKHKESDRLSVMKDNLERLGAVFEADGRTLRVLRGVRRGASDGVAVTAAGDHRIAMAMAVAALAAGRIILDDDECVSKSFPRFWEMWGSLVQPGDDPP